MGITTCMLKGSRCFEKHSETHMTLRVSDKEFRTYINILFMKLGMVVHNYNPSTWGTEKQGS
jgi:hypothetical protein